MVPILSIVFMIAALLISIALPVLTGIYFYKRKKADVLPFFIGCAVMIVFAFTLEQSAHALILGSGAGKTIRGSVLLTAVYGGLMAGLFEETGRFIVFKTVFKKKWNKDVNALMYGAGHGGIEALAILGIASLNNLIYSVLINTGHSGMLTGRLSGELLEQVQTAIDTLITTPSWHFLLGGVERIFAVAIQISLSVLVWFAAKRKGRWYLYPVAIGLHFLVDAGTVLLSGSGVSLLLVEAGIGAFAVITVLIAKIVWKKNAVSIDL